MDRFKVTHEIVRKVPMPSHPECTIATSETVWQGAAKPDGTLLGTLAETYIPDKPGPNVIEQNLVVHERVRAMLGRLVLPWFVHKPVETVFM